MVLVYTDENLPILGQYDDTVDSFMRLINPMAIVFQQDPNSPQGSITLSGMMPYPIGRSLEGGNLVELSYSSIVVRVFDDNIDSKLLEIYRRQFSQIDIVQPEVMSSTINQNPMNIINPNHI